VSSALEADAAGFSQTDPIEGAVGPTGQGLGENVVEVVSDPGDTQAFRNFMQSILGEPVLLAQRRKRSGALLFVCAGDGACLLPRRISPHLAQAFLSLREHRIIELAACFQMGTETFFLRTQVLI
jgi:hypothetical protein